MKKILLPTLIALATMQIQAQDFFALTGQDNQRINFKNIQSIDINRGSLGEIIFDNNATREVISQRLNSPIKETKASYHNAQAMQIAALAFNGNNIVYTPMFSSNIYVIDAKSKRIQLVENESIKAIACDVDSHITRMATGKDGNIYALNNASSQFIKISNINGQYIVENLGAIKDISDNNEFSLTKMQTGFGGDMIADGENNFYVFSASRNVFKINTKLLSATYVGTINGLPENFSLNGAAVNQSGNVIVGSAKGEGFYEVNIETLQAKPMQGEYAIPVYDLASNYFVNDQEEIAENILLAGVSLYPTKVNEQIFNIKFNNENVRGNLKVEVIDYMGTKVVKETLKSVRPNVEYPVRLGGINQGAYIVNVTDSNGITLHSEKILVTK